MELHAEFTFQPPCPRTTGSDAYAKQRAAGRPNVAHVQAAADEGQYAPPGQPMQQGYGAAQGAAAAHGYPGQAPAHGYPGQAPAAAYEQLLRQLEVQNLGERLQAAGGGQQDAQQYAQQGLGDPRLAAYYGQQQGAYGLGSPDAHARQQAEWLAQQWQGA